MPDAAPVMITIRAIPASRAHEHPCSRGPRNAERRYLFCNSSRTLSAGGRNRRTARRLCKVTKLTCSPAGKTGHLLVPVAVGEHILSAVARQGPCCERAAGGVR